VTTSSLVPTNLRCGHKVEPLGVELDRARFSWSLSGAGPGRYQTGYQLVVVPEGRGPDGRSSWDSGRRDGTDSCDIAYEGSALASAQRYEWNVRVWDERGHEGPWSAPAHFETGLVPGDWEAQWVGLGADHGPHQAPTEEGPVDPVALAMKPAQYLRRPFALDKPVHSGRLYVTALGVYRVSINGSRVGDAVLAPGWTDYAKRILYQTFDVTGLLARGDNVLGAVIADGWACSFYGFDGKRPGAHYARYPELLSQLTVRFVDGSEVTISTDDEWTGSTGAVVYADLLMGERRDMAKEPDGWDRPGFGSSSWRRVLCRPRSKASLVADPGPPVRVIEEIPAKTISRRPSGKLLVDFGQNLAGWVRLRVEEPPGTDVRVRHGEVLTPGGDLYVDNLRTARQTDRYLTSRPVETLEPQFTFHGFRYAEITGLGDGLEPGAVTASVVHSDTPRTGTFECSSATINKLYSNIDWGQRGNFISIPTDCPQRDERLGWLGDAQVFARTAAYNRDVASFFSKWADDVADAQLSSGAFPDFAPRLGMDWAGAPAWGDAGVIVPWTIYKMYGDRAILERNFRAMEAWMDFLATTNPGRLRVRELGNNYGDWLSPNGDHTPPELIASAYWAYDAMLMAEISRATGRLRQANGFEDLAQELRDAFAKTYIGPNGEVTSETQTAYALALHMHLVPEELRPLAAQRLVDAIAGADWHLTTGFVGVGYLLPVLSSTGYSEVAYRLLEQRSFPSWQYTIDRGATTIWERWDGWTDEHGFQSPRMNSFNHYSLGSVGEWLYRFLLGIELGPGAVGFERVIIRPHPGASLTYAQGSFQSVRGRIAAAWARESGQFRLDVEIPPNVQASVRVPSARPDEVVDNFGNGPTAISDYPGILDQKEAVFELGSGNYTFSGPELEIQPGYYGDTDGGQAHVISSRD
jgi:alpha-L-rhamnosidase